MNKMDLSFCDRCGYPKEVKRHFEVILSQIDDHLGLRRITSIILLGSSARGELSYRVDNQGVDLFSDYDLWIITQRKPPLQDVVALKKSVRKLEKEWARNPLFNIGLTVNSLRQFRLKAKLEHRIINFDTKKTGVVIYGENVLKFIPDFPAHLLDLGNTNELILVRLWMQLLYTPLGIINGDPDAYEELVFKYTLARNILEISTIFLANERVLLPTYAEKVLYMAKNYRDCSYFPPGFTAFLQDCLKTKLAVQATFPSEIYYQGLVEGYLALLSYLTNKDTRSRTRSAFFNRYQIHIAGEEYIIPLNDQIIPKLRRIRNNFMFTYKNVRRLGLSNIPKWFLIDKRPLILAFLLHMHLFFFYHLIGKEKLVFLEKAIELMSQIDGRPECGYDRKKPIDIWKRLRERIIDFMALWFYRQPDPQDFMKIAYWRHKIGDEGGA